MQLVIVDRDTLLAPGHGDGRGDGNGHVDSDSHGGGVSAELEWETVPGSLEALARLSGAGFRLVVAGNPLRARSRTFSIESLCALHHRLQHELLEAGGSVDAVFFCDCGPKEKCDCRMPKPGMLLDIATRLRISLVDVPVLAGSAAAVEAARAAGARPMRVDTRVDTQGERPRKPRRRGDVERYPDLAAAVDDLLAETAPA